MNTPPPRNPRSKRTPAIEANIIERIARGETISAACRQNGIEPRTWSDWLEATPALAQAHARAIELGHDAMAEECIAIADTPIARIVDTAGNARYDSAHVASLKLRTDTRMRLLAKLSPKYADSNRVELTGKDGGAIAIDNSAAVTELVALVRAAKRDSAPGALIDAPPKALPGATRDAP